MNKILKHDISQYHFLKATFEKLFGRNAWYEIKECTSVSKWNKYCQKTLSALEIAAKETVTVFDDEWMDTLSDEINKGKEKIENAITIDEILATLSGTLIRISFHQLGHFPDRQMIKSITLNKRYWNLNSYRSVQYVQSKDQKENST